MENYMTRVMTKNKQARMFFVENTALMDELCSNQPPHKLVRTLLARTVSCTSLLLGLIRDDHRISLKIRPSNRNFNIYADVDGQGNVRGFVNDELLNALDEVSDPPSIEQFIGDQGYIQVTHDIGMNRFMTGLTDMPHGNIIDDISHYYAQSEQTPTWISTFLVFNEQAQIELSRAVLIQLLPGSPVTLLQQLRQKITDNQAMFYSAIEEQIMETLPFIIFDDAEFLETKPIQLYCGCSKEMFYSMLYALGKDEISNAYINGKEIECACNVCGKKYIFVSDELKNFI